MGKNGKMNMSAGLLWEQHREDGHEIGRLRDLAEWLAERLAETGAKPSGTEGAGLEPETLAKAWMQAGEVEVALARAKGEGLL